MLEEINIRRQLVALRRQYASRGRRPSRRVTAVLEGLIEGLTSRGPGSSARILSVFSGVGGLDLGLTRGLGGGEHVLMVELEDYQRRVLQRHFSPQLLRADVNAVAADLRSGDLQLDVDLVVGGFPCQDLSRAGAGAGLCGSRSGLYGQMFSIVESTRPAWCVYENVTELLTKGFETVLADHHRAGYAVTWDCIPAFNVGAPHLRDRVFVVAHDPDVELAWTAPIRDSSPWRSRPNPELLQAEAQTPLDRAKLQAAGNAVVPQVAEHLGRILAGASRRGAAPVAEPVAVWLDTKGGFYSGGKPVTRWPRAGVLYQGVVYKQTPRARRRRSPILHVQTGDVVWVRPDHPDAFTDGLTGEEAEVLDLTKSPVGIPARLAEVRDQLVLEGLLSPQGALTDVGEAVVSRAIPWTYRGQGGANDAFLGVIHTVFGDPPHGPDDSVDIMLPNGDVEPFVFDMLAILPTASKNDDKGGLARGTKVGLYDPKRQRRKRGGQLRHWVDGNVNPEFSEWLMGFEQGWL